MLFSHFEKSKIEVFKEKSVVLKIKYNNKYNNKFNQEQKGHRFYRSVHVKCPQ